MAMNVSIRRAVEARKVLLDLWNAGRIRVEGTTMKIDLTEPELRKIKENLRIRSCRFCRSDFSPKKAEAQFCSGRCRSAWHREYGEAPSFKKYRAQRKSEDKRESETRTRRAVWKNLD